MAVVLADLSKSTDSFSGKKHSKARRKTSPRNWNFGFMSLEWQRRTDRSGVLVRTASLISTNPDPDLQRKLTSPRVMQNKCDQRRLSHGTRSGQHTWAVQYNEENMARIWIFEPTQCRSPRAIAVLVSKRRSRELAFHRKRRKLVIKMTTRVGNSIHKNMQSV